MREEELFDPLIDYLQKHGYKILEQNRGRKQGIDILAVKNGTKLYIQLKGEPNEPKPYVDFGTALYQIMKYMKDDSNEYAIGISDLYIDKAKQCEYSIKKLGIKIFLITESGVYLLF